MYERSDLFGNMHIEVKVSVRKDKKRRNEEKSANKKRPSQ